MGEGYGWLATSPASLPTHHKRLNPNHLQSHPLSWLRWTGAAKSEAAPQNGGTHFRGVALPQVVRPKTATNPQVALVTMVMSPRRPTIALPPSNAPRAGVRPSSRAATSLNKLASEHARTPARSWAAAPEDGRTPVAVSSCTRYRRIPLPNGTLTRARRRVASAPWG